MSVLLHELELAERPFRDPPTPPLSSWPNLIEALLRVDDVSTADKLFAGYAEEAEQLGEPLPRALVERCRGLHPRKLGVRSRNELGRVLTATQHERGE